MFDSDPVYSRPCTELLLFPSVFVAFQAAGKSFLFKELPSAKLGLCILCRFLLSWPHAVCWCLSLISSPTTLHPRVPVGCGFSLSSSACRITLHPSPPHRQFPAEFDLRGRSWLLPSPGLLVSWENEMGCFRCGPSRQAGVHFHCQHLVPKARVQGYGMLLPDPGATFCIWEPLAQSSAPRSLPNTGPGAAPEHHQAGVPSRPNQKSLKNKQGPQEGLSGTIWL